MHLIEGKLAGDGMENKMAIEGSSQKIINSLVVANQLKINHSKVIIRVQELIDNKELTAHDYSEFNLNDMGEKVITYQLTKRALNKIEKSIKKNEVFSEEEVSIA